MRLAFLCTHNACRSILCEAIVRQRAAGRIPVASAGSAPRGCVHPSTIAQLVQRGYDVSGLASKGIDDLEAFAPDVVITVCDTAAQEACPVWLGDVPRVHWGLPDPTRGGLSAAATEMAFTTVIATIERRVDQLLQTDSFPADGAEIQSLLQELATLAQREARG